MSEKAIGVGVCQHCNWSKSLLPGHICVDCKRRKELQWTEQDFRIACDNLVAAQRQLSDATNQWYDARDALAKARKAVAQ